MGVAFLSEFAGARDWAAMYRSLGLQVVPGRAGEKRPLVDWVEWQNALVPPAQFDRWFGPDGEFRNLMAMGLLTGACSRALRAAEETSGLMLVDLDVKEVANGLQWWRTFVEVYLGGLEPQTWRARTPGGGLHIFFLAPAGWIAPTVKFPALGVDVRGQGGYVVVAPSMREGREYAWLEGYEPWECELAIAPVELCEAIDRLRAEHGGTPGAAPRERTDATTVRDAFGHDIDGREEKLRDVVWAAVVDLRRESPVLPSLARQESELARIWTQYEATTRSRLPRDPGATNADLLEREGRGWSELRKKWLEAMAKWDGKVAEAATFPKPEMPGNPALPVDSTLDEFAPEVPPTLESLGLRRLSDVKARPAPRQWVSAGWLPKGEVTLLSSDPGLGKSLLALQLMCSTAVGGPWLGLETAKGSSLFVTCEDSDDEIDSRFSDVREAMGYALSAPFADAVVTSRRHKENRLTIRGQHQVLGLGPYHPELVASLGLVTPDLLILDTLADFYTGNENDRSEVNWFVKTVLGGLIAKANGHLSILLLGHTSRREGSEFSGSSAWEGSVRARLFLERPKDGGPTERELSRSKANYAGGDDGTLALMWEAGAMRVLGDTLTGQMEVLVRTVTNEVDYAQRSGRAYTSAKGAERNIYKVLPGKLGLPPTTPEMVREAIRRAIRDGQIEKAGGTRGEWKKR